MTEHEYNCCLQAVSALVSCDPHPETPMGRALLELSAACEAYEKRHFPMTDDERIQRARDDEDVQ